MTDVTPLIKSNQMVIQSYGPQGFKISGTQYDHHVIVFPERVVSWDGDVDNLIRYKNDIDVALVGTGTTLKLLPRERRLALKNEGLHIEMMDTGAACRTYNALMADGRRIAAALTKI